MTYQPLKIPEELNALDIPPVEYLIDGIVPRGAFIQLTAREKAGKTLMLTDALFSIAAGEAFLDREVSQGPALLLAMEDSVRDLRVRFNARLNGLTDIPAYLLPCDGSVPDLRFSLEDPESLGNLAQMITDFQLVAVGIDPMRETHSQPENNSDEMSPLLRTIRQIAHATDCAILMTHHDNRAGTGSRGSTAIAAAFDQICHWKLTDPDSDELRGTLRIVGRYGPRTTIRATYGAHGRWLLDSSVIPSTNTRERIARHLEAIGGWHSAKDILSGLADNSVNLKTVQNLIGEMVRADEVIRRGSGKPGDPFTYAVVGTSRMFPDVPDEPSGRVFPVPDGIGAGAIGNTSNSLNGKLNGSAGQICPDCKGPLPADRKHVCADCQSAAYEALEREGIAF